jgi:endo-alpha-N-acetylgalactosaminidase
MKYIANFNNKDISNWKKSASSTGEIEVKLLREYNRLYIKENVICVDTNSPEFNNGLLDIDFRVSKEGRNIGVIIKYSDDNNFLSVGLNEENKWGWESGDGNKNYAFKGPELKEGRAYNFKIKHHGEELYLWVNGKLVFKDTVLCMPKKPGKVGFRSGHKKNVIAVDDIYCVEIKDLSYISKQKAIENSIESEKLVVTIDETFPRIINYKLKNSEAILYGQEEVLNEIKINDYGYIPQVKFNKVSHNKVLYNLNIDEIKVDIDIAIEAIDNVLNLRVTDIKESGDELVKTIEIPSHSLVSVRTSQEDAKVTAARIWGILTSTDEFQKLSDMTEEYLPAEKTMIIVNTDKVAASIENNVLYKQKRVLYQVENKEEYKKCGVWNGVWTYREIDSEIYELPWSKIVISEDENGDGVIDWQDGVIGFRKHMQLPFGHDLVRNNVSHIVMDFASIAQYPFLRVLDNIKKYHNYVDGFGQMVLVKGYEGEGHDSAHPDYGGHFNPRAGGKKEFNELIEGAHKYNAKIGVHINATEYHLESKNYNPNILKKGAEDGWAWLDTSHYVDRRLDITSGELYRRLEELKNDLSDLDWVYVDVYMEKNPWNEYKLASKINDLGFALGTEWPGPMDNWAIWNHWQDIGYDTTGDGMTSKIIRFVRNQIRDSFPHHPLLKSNDNKGFMGWEGDLPREKDLLYAVEKFFTWSLVGKYMQNFPIIKWTDNEVQFEDGVKSVGEGKIKIIKKVPDTDGVYKKEQIEIPQFVKIYKDNKLIYSGENYQHEGERVQDRNNKILSKNNLVFIPWNPFEEDKIYHWNDNGGASTWELPKSWGEITKVKLYKLTGAGRVFVRNIQVSDGKVNLEVLPKTPYVIYKAEKETLSTIWGEYSIVKDMSFDSHEFKAWKKSSTTLETEHIQFAIEDTVGLGRGYSYLLIKGNNGADGTITQDITGLTPGKTYAASVWVEVSKGRKAIIGVKNYGGSEVTAYVDSTDVKNYNVNCEKHNTNFHRMRIIFTMPENKNSATLYLKAETGTPDSYVKFDDVRIVETKDNNQGKYYFYEDFENVDEGWGPFMYAYDGLCQTHLSERNDPYTKDVISGEFSLKTKDEEYAGEIYRTIPGILRFEAGKKYKVSLDYMAYNEYGKTQDYQYKFVLRSREHGELDTISEYYLPKTKYNDKKDGEVEVLHIDWTFETGEYKEAYIAAVKENKEKGILIIDNIIVEEFQGELLMPPVPNSCCGVSSVDMIKIKTVEGRIPKLPKVVSVKMEDNTEVTVPAVWEYISPSKYEKEGIFTVSGKLYGIEVEIKAEIEVTKRKKNLGWINY